MPRLDLDIPDHRMERYSVMFEKFLDGNVDRRPSIIERRQSKLQKKRSLKRLDADKFMPTIPQRSATSPHLSRMPSLSIQTGKKVRSPRVQAPATEELEPVTAVLKPLPPKRSNTAPPKAASPTRQNFSKPRAVAVAQDAVPEQSALARGLSVYSENSLPPTPTDEESVVEFQPPLPPKRAAAAGGSSRTPQKQRQPDPYQRVKSPEDLEKHVVQVSVARQVSVTKARKQVRQAVDAKQPLRPRVVELSKNRKSTVVLIEGADE